ncbi:uncharacterized protein [Rutidosis leptorrhynchoides]|uniref:uncharacterized protein isoform X1 n=1 Tax=Rutidosis leptorrhynchoides TaxID=125765 RepID=UPI003A9A2D00
MEKPVILAVSSCRPKVFRGELQLNGTQATHCYFNPPIPEFIDSVTEYRERFLAHPPLAINRQRSNDMAIERFRNRYPIAELVTHNLNNYRSVDFTCEVTIEQVAGNREWFYKSCNDCSLRVLEDIDQPNRYTCRTHRTHATCKHTCR